jgi:hypothetical protein
MYDPENVLPTYLPMALQTLVGPWPLFQFLSLLHSGRTPWTGDQPVARPLPAYRTAQTQNKGTQTSTPQVRFESTIQVSERVKIFHDLDRAATVIGPENVSYELFLNIASPRM